MRIFLIEDDLAIGSALLGVLQEEGHTVVWVRMAGNAAARVQRESFDVVLLDLGLPDEDGFSLLRRIRAAGADVPVLLITARDSLEDRLRGFDAGADDYMIKPFDIPELLVRLRAILRRTGAGAPAAPVWRHADLVLDENRMQLTRAGADVVLSRTEFALLAALMRHADRVLTRAEIEARVLPHSEGQTLDVHMSNLRRKIGEGYIRTVRGVGFMIRRKDTP